jgi:dihydroorotase/N-acyl-D-amino-acid deacylase
VGIRGDRIVALTRPGELRDAPPARRVDATGKVVAPGFIDIQSHSRGSFLGSGDGRVVSKVVMGVTTEIMGEATTNGPSSPEMLRAAGSAAGRTRFETFGQWIDAMEAHGASVNYGSFVGASTIRILGMGRAMGEAGSPQRRLMQQAVRESMRDGAFGVASALVYPPGNFASTEELISINAAAAPFGGVYITHMRSEADNYLEGIDEAIEIGTAAGVPIEIYHLKAAGRRNWHKAALAVAKIDSARAAGVDIQANMYPYTAGGTGLDACFPPWASADGALFANLADPAMRARIRQEIEHQTEPWESFCTLATPEGTMPLGLNLPEHQKYRGWWLGDIAEDMGKDWIDTAFDLVLHERQRVSTMYFLMSEENVAMQLGLPWIKFGTDAGGIDPTTATGLAHPPCLWDLYPDTREVRARGRGDVHGGGRSEDVVGRGDSVAHSGSRIPPGRLLRRPGHLRPRDRRRPRHVRRTPPTVHRNRARVREWRSGRLRRRTHRHNARSRGARPRVEGVGTVRLMQRNLCLLRLMSVSR